MNTSHITEESDCFIEWASEWLTIRGRIPHRYAIVWAKYGTGLKWVQVVSNGFGYESHGNFYGDTFGEALTSCRSAVKQIIELDQKGSYYDVWTNTIK